MAEIYDHYDNLVKQGTMSKGIRGSDIKTLVTDEYISFKKPQGLPPPAEMINFITGTIISQSLGEAIRIADSTSTNFTLSIGNLTLSYNSKNKSWTSKKN